MQNSSGGTATVQKTDNGQRLTGGFDVTGCEQWLGLLPPKLQFPAGTELFEQGVPPQETFLIEAGVVKLVERTAGGKETILGLRFPGWLLGASVVFLDRPSPVAVLTLTPCYLRRIPVAQFIALIRSNLKFSLFLHRTMSLEIFEHLAHSAGLAHHTARERLEHLIWRLMTTVETVATSEGVRLRLPLKQDEIAQLLAISPSYLCRLLDQTEAQGVLRRKNGWLVVPDRNKLWHSESDPQD